MQTRPTFLEQSDDELERYLLKVARRDVAPLGARERALASATTAALATSIAASSAALSSKGTLGKASVWLAAKWLLIGAGSGLAAIATAEGVQSLNRPSEPERSPSIFARTSRTTAERTVPSEPVRGDAAPSPAIAIPSESFASVADQPRARRLAPEATNAPPDRTTEAPTQSGPSPLGRELQQLERVRTAITRKDGMLALRALEQYSFEYPGGALQVEAEALRVEAVALSGNSELARRLADAFLARNPSNPLSARVRSVAGAP